ncbi:uncharacterized protein [Periplaneta americana]|uniref:uncharacterized protein n=1 Tax=Periplaneta americana TaxID=6978 RepID=UPI0037E841DF
MSMKSVIGLYVLFVVGSHCVMSAKVVGGACSTDTDCSDVQNSLCDSSSKTCKCLSDYIAVEENAKCFPVANTLSAGCEYNEQCTQKLGTAECKDYQCHCAPEAVLNADGKGCSSSAVQNVVSVASLVVLYLLKFL